MNETDNFRCSTNGTQVRVFDKGREIEHRFAEGTEELAYLGPLDVCPERPAEAATDFSGKPVK